MIALVDTLKKKAEDRGDDQFDQLPAVKTAGHFMHQLLPRVPCRTLIGLFGIN